jgi:hypothetical protein
MCLIYVTTFIQYMVAAELTFRVESVYDFYATSRDV